MVKLISWNVNSLRACCDKGLISFIKKTKADIYALQEIKCLEEQVPEDFSQLKNYYKYYYPAQRKGYSGVASICRTKPSKVEYGIGSKKFDDEGRTLTLHFEDYIFMNCYFPNGRRDHSRVPFKLEYSELVLKKIKKLVKQGKNVIVTGDFNTAHTDIDLSNPKTNKKTTGFLPEEKAFHDKLIKNGFADIFRSQNPDKTDIYSWWTYRNNCRERNIGWRIDYFFCNEDYLPNVKSTKYMTEVMGSDHCPVELRINENGFNQIGNLN